MSNWIEREKNTLLSTYNRYPVVIDHGEGVYLYDDQHREYLDLFSGLAVNVLGHCHPLLVKKGKEQLEKYLHVSNFYYCKNGIRLAEKLIERSFPGKVFFANSGTEATEGAIKYLYKIGKHRERKGIVVFTNSFHGRTLGALSATKMNSVAQDFPPVNYPFYEVGRNSMEDLEGLFSEKKPVAVLFEIISGSGGVEVFSETELERIQQLCRRHGVLMAVDEIQTGVGRTGRFFAYQHFTIDPDLVIFAKGIGGGNPLGGFIVNHRIDGFFSPGDHGTTFGPSPLSTAMGLGIMEVMNDGFLSDVTGKSRKLKEGLTSLKEKFPEAIGEIRGFGMMLGVELKKGSGVSGSGKTYIQNLQQGFMEKGILVNFTQGKILRLLPPLIIQERDIQKFINGFEELLKQS